MKWPIKKLGEIAKVEWGNTSITKKQYATAGFLAISASGPDGFLPFFDHDGSAIILSAIGAKCGKCFLVNGRWTAIKNTIVIIPDQKQIDIKYLFLFINDENKWQRVKSAAQPFISQNNARELQIPLPPLSVQKQIVEWIEKLFSKIDEAEKLLKESLDASSILFNSALQKVFKRGEKEGWEVKKLGEVTILNPKKLEINNLSDFIEVSFVPMSLIDEKNQIIIKSEIKKLAEVKKGYTYFKDGDVIFAKITPCMENGKIAIAENLKNGIGFGSTEFHVIRPTNQVMSKWIFYIIGNKSFRLEAKKHMTGTAGQQRVPVEFLKNFLISLPPFSEQKKIIEYLDGLREKVEELKRLQEEQLKSLEELRKSILKKAIFERF